MTNHKEFVFLLIGVDGDNAVPQGSGFFVAPGLAMTARHVVHQMWKGFQLYEGFNNFPGRKIEVEGNFGAVALQFVGEDQQQAIWHVEKAWVSDHTDAAFLNLKPQNETAKQYKWEHQLVLSMYEPMKQQKIEAYGFPKSLVEKQTSPTLFPTWRLTPVTIESSVTDVCPKRHSRGFVDFPVIETDAVFENGMSGGPIFNTAGQVCAIVNAGSHGCLLWLAMLTGMDLWNIVPFWAAELFHKGILRQDGWVEVFREKEPLFNVCKDEDDNWVLKWTDDE